MCDKLVENLWKKRKERVLIAAHRGTEGGNMIQNTVKAYKNAIAQKADIIEVDVAMSRDGVFYTFHTGQEERVFGFNCSINKMDSRQLDNLWIRNGIFDLVDQRVSKFEDVVNELAEETCIVVDRSWFQWEEFLEFVVQHNLSRKIIVKVPVDNEKMEVLSKLAPELNFMGIVKDESAVKVLKAYDGKINLVGLELIFQNSEDKIVSEEFIANCHNEKWLLWVNALNLNDSTILAGGFDDDTSILKSKSAGWGELIHRNFDIIQTDWPLLLSNYIKER